MGTALLQARSHMHPMKNCIKVASLYQVTLPPAKSCMPVEICEAHGGNPHCTSVMIDVSTGLTTWLCSSQQAPPLCCFLCLSDGQTRRGWEGAAGTIGLCASKSDHRKSILLAVEWKPLTLVSTHNRHVVDSCCWPPKGQVTNKDPSSHSLFKTNCSNCVIETDMSFLHLFSMQSSISALQPCLGVGCRKVTFCIISKGKPGSP